MSMGPTAGNSGGRSVSSAPVTWGESGTQTRLDRPAASHDADLARLINATLDARAAGFDTPEDYETWRALDGARTLRLHIREHQPRQERDAHMIDMADLAGLVAEAIGRRLKRDAATGSSAGSAS